MNIKKNIYIIASLLTVTTCLFFAIYGIIKSNIEAEYCGRVVDKYIINEYRENSARHVIFYNDSLKMNIYVRVTNQTYVNTEIGENICFDLTKKQLQE